ncbi:uncharacterized protein [Drosophila virilis]|uniref:Nematode cuticle collagen N-terminal domain-containing protein n=1 Tax=Drosophila virilis TaxID=7244 RepID=A0A0Q9WCW6_DROVI|nr:uncharacterized protein LOC26531060 [Drosophila virilis]KRF78750.1 uncharacterized protein Dvir_GJ26290 [Drosophila virilis]
MGRFMANLKDNITAERVAIFFGLLSTCLAVALVIVVVHRDNLMLQLSEAREKLDVLEDYIQTNVLSDPTEQFEAHLRSEF